MKVLLINPPFEPADSVGESRSVRFVLNITPPLGLAYLAAFLEKKGDQVKILDYTSRYSYPPLLRILEHFRPDIIGITATTPSFTSAGKIARECRKLLPRIPLVIGGAHVTAAPESAMADGEFDIGVLGEGEESFAELLTRLKNADSKKLSRCRGIIYRDEHGNVTTDARPFISELDSLPFPAYHLLPPLSAYHPTPASYRLLPVGILMTSRGCPHQCTFCDRSVFGNRIRFHSPERIVSDVEELVKKHGAREIRFFDDAFTLNRERTFTICEELQKHELALPWTCLTTARSVDPEMLRAMKKAGCWQVLYGLESGDERMLKLLKKGNTVEINRRAVRWAREAGLEVRGDFIVGTPGETMKSLENTLRFALEEELDYAHFNKFVPFPGTELYRRLIRDGYSFDFSRSCSILDHGALLYVPDSLTPGEYRKWLDRAFKKFYLRPSHILKRLLSIRTWTQFKGQVRGAFSMLGL